MNSSPSPIVETINSLFQQPAVRLDSLTSTFREHPKIAGPVQITDDGSIMMESIEVARLPDKATAERALLVRKWERSGDEWRIR